MTRRPAVILVVILVATGVVLATLIASRPRTTDRPEARAASDAGELTLLVVRSNADTFSAVVGSTGQGSGALVIPTKISVTVPGQGDARLDEALALPPRQAATTVANLLGVWVHHYAILGRLRLAALVDRVGGLEVAGEMRDGMGVVALLEDAKPGRTLAFQLVLRSLLDSGVQWGPADLDETDDAAAALATLQRAEDADVAGLRTVEPAEGIFRAEPEAVRDGIVRAFGGPDRDIVGVIVLNGSGVPGVGEVVAEKLVPDGFSLVVSENASTFDHDETLVVVGSSNDVGLGQRVRDLLGTGSVNVSVSSGLAPVTIVVGKDLGA